LQNYLQEFFLKKKSECVILCVAIYYKKRLLVFIYMSLPNERQMHKIMILVLGFISFA